jgi:hypothetical protein
MSKTRYHPCRSASARKSCLSSQHFFLEQDICPLFVLFDSPPTGLAIRPDNAATQLLLDSWKRCCAATASRSSNCKACAAAQSGRKEAAQKEKGVFRDALVHPPDARPRTPAKGFALCTPKNCRGESQSCQTCLTQPRFCMMRRSSLVGV